MSKYHTDNPVHHVIDSNDGYVFGFNMTLKQAERCLLKACDGIDDGPSDPHIEELSCTNGCNEPVLGWQQDGKFERFFCTYCGDTYEYQPTPENKDNG